MRILFMGTPDFASASLSALLDAGHEICGAVCQPDKPVGRKQTLTPPPVKVLALKNKIEVYQPETLKNQAFLPVLEVLLPELIAVVAYGRILPEYILNFPQYGCINVHGSLLPSLRGAAPIQWTIINGEEFAGVTTMHMARELDSGDIIFQSSTKVLPGETSGELYERLQVIGGALLCKTVSKVLEGTAPRIPQDHTIATYAPMLNKEMAVLDFSKTAWQLECQVRGLNPWPVAHTLLFGQALKVFAAHATQKSSDSPAGTVIGADGKNGILVSCGGNTVLALTEVQPLGGKRMPSCAFLNGHKLEPGTALGI